YCHNVTLRWGPGASVAIAASLGVADKALVVTGNQRTFSVDWQDYTVEKPLDCTGRLTDERLFKKALARALKAARPFIEDQTSSGTEAVLAESFAALSFLLNQKLTFATDVIPVRPSADFAVELYPGGVS